MAKTSETTGRARQRPKRRGGKIDQISAREKELLVLDLRRQDWTFEEIAAHVPEGSKTTLYADESGAHKAYRRALDRITATDARAALERDLHRLEKVIEAQWTKAIAGDGEAARVILRAIRDRARILGYSTAASGSIPEALLSLVSSIQALRDPDEPEE